MNTTENNICWFCEKREVVSVNNETILLHREISRSNNWITEDSVRYQTTAVTVLRCNECWEKEGGDEKLKNKNEPIGCLGIFGVVIFTFILMGAASIASSGEPIIFFGIMALGVFWFIFGGKKTSQKKNKSTDDHPNVRRYLKQGWQFGDKPGDVEGEVYY